MIYGELDYKAMERDAYQRGDTDLSVLLAELIDRSEEVEELEERVYELEQDQRDKEADSTAELQDKIEELEEKLDKAYELVYNAARVSNRKAILRALTE